MIVHYAFFKWKRELDSATLQRLREEFAALQAVIPEIRSFRWVYNNSTENLDKGFREGIRVEFDSIEARERYLAHPAHVAFATDVVIPALEDGLASVLVFDYEDTTK
ncbi:MAG: Dabb family protein [bacterium]|nr:Dabb family protein [bacterium]